MKVLILPHYGAVNAGYLTISKVLDYLRSKCRIEIPNNEVEREFVQLLKSI